MGFFGFLKNKKEIKNEILKLEDLDKWVKIKKQENDIKDNELIKEINLKVKEFIIDVRNKIDVLEKIDLEDKKVEDKIKFIVLENLDKYIFYLKKLNENLEKLINDPKLKANELINKINLIFIDFDKKSMLNFEKATFIIGKELGSVKESISNFFKVFNKIIDENKESFEFSNRILLINEKLNEMNKNQLLKKDSEENIIKNNEKIKNYEEEIGKIEKEIQKIRKSHEYELEIKEKKLIEDEKIKIKEKIDDIRDLVDFRKLSGIFHSDKKKMDVINKYRDRFQENFEYDNGEDIIKLLDEADIESENIKNIVRNIIEMRSKIDEKTEVIDLTKSSEAKLISLENYNKSIKNDINDVNFDIDREKKKILKFEENYGEIIKFIKQELGKINLELIS